MFAEMGKIQMAKQFCAVVLVTMMLLPVPAASKGWGAGAIDCGEWLTQRMDDDYYPAAHWLQGFISSYSYYNDSIDVVGDVSPEALLAYIDKYCQDNPLSGLGRATQAFIERDR